MLAPIALTILKTHPGHKSQQAEVTNETECESKSVCSYSTELHANCLSPEKQFPEGIKHCNFLGSHDFAPFFWKKTKISRHPKWAIRGAFT